MSLQPNFPFDSRYDVVIQARGYQKPTYMRGFNQTCNTKQHHHYMRGPTEFCPRDHQKKILGEEIATFTLVGSPKMTKKISFDTAHALAIYTYKKLILITNVILYAAAGNLSHYKKQRYWIPLNSALLKSFISRVIIMDRHVSVTELLKLFTQKTDFI